MLHACFTPFVSCFVYTLWRFYAFSRTILLTRCHSASSMFSAILCFRKATREIFSELDETKTQTPIFPGRRTRTEREPEGGQRAGSIGGGARPSWPRQGVVRPPWWPSDAAPPPIKSLPKENPKTVGVFPRTVPQRRRHRRQISGDRSLYSGTLPGREVPPEPSPSVSIAISAVSIDLTAISLAVAASYDEEGVVLPRG
jgi:hypothetical protein